MFSCISGNDLPVVMFVCFVFPLFCSCFNLFAGLQKMSLIFFPVKSCSYKLRHRVKHYYSTGCLTGLAVTSVVTVGSGRVVHTSRVSHHCTLHERREGSVCGDRCYQGISKKHIMNA